jgi:hypothetical protein
MPGSLARPPSASIEARGEGEDSLECSQRSTTDDHGGGTAVQPRLWRQGHPPVAAPARKRRRAHGRAQHGGGVGVAVVVQPTRSRGDHHQHRRAQGEAPASSPEQIEPLGLDPQRRSSEAMSAMRGVADETLRSGSGAQRAEAEAPESGGGSRRSWARDASATRVARADRIRVSTESERE